MRDESDFPSLFTKLTGNQPWPWQLKVGTEEACVDRVLRIPTGFGKTAGTVLPWLFHRVIRGDRRWPTRLVFCLPMRVLVEQTERNIRTWLNAAGCADVGLHVLMGGVDAGAWLSPEKPAVLLGTQDMLLSRALMRGYGSSRGKWPMEFGLLNNDALWVLDEVQIMGVGLATSTQLSALHARRGTHRPVRHWWMSATLQPSWLATVDFAAQADALSARIDEIPGAQRKGGLFRVNRALSREPKVESDALGALVQERHEARTVTLVIVNTVERAVAVAEALSRSQKPKRGAAEAPAPDVRLVHSRFRGAERANWQNSFLSRTPSVPVPPAGRIIVATQVVEAGVDLSAKLLITELAPWPSLVQRFGRCARYEGESGAIVVVGEPAEKVQEAAPYEPTELAAAHAALKRLGDEAGPTALAEFEESLTPKQRDELYPFRPRHVLREKDLNELFDTSADLGGADLDVGRFIRPDNERDVSVFWRDVDPKTKEPANQPLPTRDELCPVPLFGKRGLEEWMKTSACWTYDYLDGRWRRATRRPPAGALVMLAASQGGYDTNTGWNPKSEHEVAVVQTQANPRVQQLERAANGQGDDALSEAVWQSIADHGRDVAKQASVLGIALGLDDADRALLSLAGRWHDAGKAHAVFQDAITEKARQLSSNAAARDWAKAPRDAWQRYGRPGFRHELVSTLMMFEALHRAAPTHEASAGGVADVLAAIGVTSVQPTAPLSGALADELKALDVQSFNLAAYLVCAHHGKARCQWAASPLDQDKPGRVLGVEDGDEVASTQLALADGAEAIGPLTLHLDAANVGASPRYGASWAERVESLLGIHGPFKLAFLETLLRCADWRASAALEVKS